MVSYDEIALRSEIDAKPSLLLYGQVAANPSAAGAMPVITRRAPASSRRPAPRVRRAARRTAGDRRVRRLVTPAAARLERVMAK